MVTKVLKQNIELCKYGDVLKIKIVSKSAQAKNVLAKQVELFKIISLS